MRRTKKMRLSDFDESSNKIMCVSNRDGLKTTAFTDLFHCTDKEGKTY